MHTGTSLHEECMELYTILAVLLSYTFVYANAVGISAAAAVVFHRSSALAVLLDNSHTVDVYDRFADRFDDNATCNREESMRSQWRGEKCGSFEVRVLYIIRIIEIIKC